MLSILIISTTNAQTQQVKRILQQQADQFYICGSADNSVLGMSLIESTRPDYVIMDTFMSFWNAEDLINYLLPRAICPMFILLHDGEVPLLSGPAGSRVAGILPAENLPEAELLQILGGSISHESNGDRALPNALDSAVQHSLEVMELLMGLAPLHTSEAQMKFGRLRVGAKDCWLLLGAPRQEAGTRFSFFQQIGNLDQVFNQITRLLNSLGRSELCIYRENNLCVLLEIDQPREPDWEALIRRINDVLAPFCGPLQFEISDTPLPMELWHSQCGELLRLRDKRFFLSRTYLQPKTLTAYYAEATQAQVRDQLAQLSLALQSPSREDTRTVLCALEEMVSHNLSMDLYYFVSTQLAVQYSRFVYSHGLEEEGDRDLSGFGQFPSVQAAFSAFREMFSSLFERMNRVRTSNQLVQAVCSFINENLSEPLSLTSAAAHVHVNPTYLSRLFKREVGCTFSTYVSQHRILWASQLLATPRKIIDISGMVGFDSPKYFSQVFRKQMGQTPQQYRAMLRKETES